MPQKKLVETGVLVSYFELFIGVLCAVTSWAMLEHSSDTGVTI